MNNKKTFKVEVDGKEVEVAVIRPTNSIINEADKVSGKAYAEAIKSGLLVSQKIDDVLREQNLWDDEKRKRLEELTASILNGEFKLKKGGIKLSEAKEIAIQMRRDRNERYAMMSKRNELEQHTAESFAQNKRFNYLVSQCTVHADTGKKYFDSHEAYLENEDNIVSLRAAQELSEILYNLDENFEKKLPENAFLLKHKLVNEELSLINKDGHLVDTKGRLIDKQGRLVDQDGNLIDDFGHKYSENGEYLVDEQPFLDDDGNPITEDVVQESQDSVEENTDTSLA